MHLVPTFMPVKEGFIAFIEGLPGANTQGATLEEAEENLKEAVALILDANRELENEGKARRECVE
jgi:predicted RNase H-like HicB family nuclease